MTLINVYPRSTNDQAASFVLLGPSNNSNSNRKNHITMAVNQKAISAKIDLEIFSKLEAWCQLNKVKRNAAINMAIDSLLDNGIPKRWR